jgi:hypothetical protein
MNFVDFIFYSAYGLLGPWRAEYFRNLWFAINKLLSLVLFYDCVGYTKGLVVMALSRVKHSKHDHFASFYLEYATEAVRHKYLNNKWVRFLNASFHLKLLVYMILIVTLQHSLMGVALLMGLTVLSLLYLVVLMVVLDPFVGWATNLQKLSFEICMAFFFLAITTKFIGVYHIYTDYGVIGLTLLCIISQVLYAIYSLVQIIKRKCKCRSKKPDIILQPSTPRESSRKLLAKYPETKVADKPVVNPHQTKIMYPPGISNKPLSAALPDAASQRSIKSTKHRNLVAHQPKNNKRHSFDKNMIIPHTLGITKIRAKNEMLAEELSHNKHHNPNAAARSQRKFSYSNPSDLTSPRK